MEVLLWRVLGTSVVLDYGSWAREERQDLCARAYERGAGSEVHFLNVPAEELLRRLAVRNSEPPATDELVRRE